MVTCIFCANTAALPINASNGINQPLKNCMLKCFGKCIEDSFRDGDSLCNTCALVVQFIAKLKDRLLPYITREQNSNDCDKPTNINFITMWENFCNSTFNQLELESPTADLIYYTHAEEYNEPVEKRLEINEYIRSTSRLSTTSRHSEAESELSKYMRSGGKRKRRKHRTRFTHRKKHKFGEMYRSRSRATSTASYTYYQSLDSEPITPVIVRENHISSRDKGNEEPEYNITLQPEFQFYCSEHYCDLGYETLEDLTEHLVNYHRKLAFHNCTLCKNRYCTREHLKEHMKFQHRLNVICKICREELTSERAYTDHWHEIHFKNSVKCSECGKRYLNNRVLHKHIREEHNTLNNQRKLSRITYVEDSVPNGLNENNSNITDNSNEFEVRVLMQCAKKCII